MQTIIKSKKEKNEPIVEFLNNDQKKKKFQNIINRYIKRKILFFCTISGLFRIFVNTDKYSSC